LRQRNASRWLLPAARFLLVVRPSGCVAGDLGDRHSVQTAVELAVSGPGQAVASDLPGGGLDRCGAGVGGERGRRSETVHGVDASQDLGGVEGTDAAELGQGAARCVDGCFDIAGGFGDAAIELADLGDKVDSEAAQRLGCMVAGPYLAQDVGGAGCGQTTRGTRGCEMGEQHMQAVEGLGADLDQVVAVFHEGTQGGDCGVDGSGIESGRGHCGDAHRDCVGLIGLAAMPGGQHPDSGSEFGRHVDHLNAVGVQPLGQWGAQSGGAFDGPAGVTPPSGESSQLPIALPTDPNPNDIQRLQRGVKGGRGPRCLVRVDRDHDTIAGWCCSHG
jgi:hypothetical protein